MRRLNCSTPLMNKNVFSEFRTIKLGDKRLEERAERIVQRLVENPAASFPNIFSNQAELEAFYRFVENPYIKSDALFEGHRSATVERELKATKKFCSFTIRQNFPSQVDEFRSKAQMVFWGIALWRLAAMALIHSVLCA